MEQQQARRRTTATEETQPSRAPLRRVRTAPVPVVYDPIEEVAARALTPPGDVRGREGRALRVVDPLHDAGPAEAVTPRATALRRDGATAPLMALEAPVQTAVAPSTPTPGTAMSRSGARTMTATRRSTATDGRSEWERLEDLILAERVRVLADRMAREARAQDPSDPLRATRARIA